MGAQHGGERDDERPQLPRPGHAFVQRQVHATEEAVTERVEQRLLVVEVPVERHRGDAELAREPAHADRVDALGVGHGQSAIEDCVAAEGRMVGGTTANYTAYRRRCYGLIRPIRRTGGSAWARPARRSTRSARRDACADTNCDAGGSSRTSPAGSSRSAPARAGRSRTTRRRWSAWSPSSPTRIAAPWPYEPPAAPASRSPWSPPSRRSCRWPTPPPTSPSTSLALCSVSDPARALAELRRVLRPRGSCDSSSTSSPSAARSACSSASRRRCTRACPDGCHIARDTLASIERAGFVVEECQRFMHADGPLEPAIPHVLGTARLL